MYGGLPTIDVEAALGEDFGEGGLPVEGFGMHRRVADDAVALADGVVEAGQALAASGGLDPEAELADLDGLGVEVHAVEVVLENLPVEVEEGALPAQLLQAGVGDFIAGVELVEGLDQERAAATGQVEDAKTLEHLLPRFPEADEGVALRFVEGAQVVGVGVGQRFAGGAGGFRLVLLAQLLEAGFQHAAQRLPDDVAGDEGGGIDRAFLLASLSRLGFVHSQSRAVRPACPFCVWRSTIRGRRDALPYDAKPQPFEVSDGLLEDVAEDVHVNGRADFGVLVRVGHFARGPVVVIAEVFEIGADFVRHLEGVQRWIGGEEAAVVGGDVQAGVAFVNGAEQAPEVVPDGPGIVRVAVFEGVLEGFGGQQTAVFAKGAEQHAVQQLLNAAEDFPRGNRGVLATKPGEHPLADVGVERVELAGEFVPDGFRGA